MKIQAQPATAGGDQARLELISFHIGEQAFCADLLALREIRGWAQATPLPQAPDFILGVINLRGAVLPIIDLGARLGLGATQPSARSAILVAELSGRLVGLLVDGVNEILTVPSGSMQPTPDVGSSIVREFVRGLLEFDGRMLTLLALDRILPEPEVLAA